MTMSEAGKLGAIKSSEIAARLKKERIDEYLKNPTLCKVCSAVLDYSKRKNKFCGHSCSASYTNSTRTYKRELKNSSKNQKCINCEATLIKKWSKKYCNSQCQASHNIKLRKIRAERGEKLSPRALKTIHLKQAERCSICNNTTWNQVPITLELDHIDGNSDNNTLENTRLLCPNCHSQTPTYKSKNKGRGRHVRRQRYAQGKSF